MKLPDFEYVAPASADQVVKLLASRLGEAKVIAGGQSLLPTMAYRLAQPALLIDLKNLAELNRIVVEPTGVVLGARTRWRDIEDSEELKTGHPLLKEAIIHVAHAQVRNRGTVGGSLAHADPASEMPCIAVTCGAEILVLGSNGERLIKAEDLFVGPLMTSLAEDELILEVRLPAWPADRRWAFKEFARRTGDFALAGVAVFYDLNEQNLACNVRIGVAGAGSCPLRLTNAERALNGQLVNEQTIQAAAMAASEQVEPLSDLHASAAYRKSLVGTLLKRALEEALNRNRLDCQRG